MHPISIERVEAHLVELPTLRPHRLAMHTIETQTTVILRIRCSDGIDGLGEAATIGGLSYAGESPESIKTNIDCYFAPLLIGQNPYNLNALMQRLDSLIKGNTFARSAVESALLDAQGKRLGLSVAEVLGGPVQSCLEVAWVLASGDTGRDIQEAEQMLEARRHRQFKVKLGAREPTLDIQHAVAIKQALGNRASVRVDINQSWSEAVCIRACTQLADAGVELIEQPLPRHLHRALARLNRRSPIPLMADEAIESVADSFMLASEGAAPVFSLKIAKTGGPCAVLRAAAIARAAGIDLYGGTMLESSIGTLASAHAFTTLPELKWGTELFGPLLLVEDVVLQRPEYRDFKLWLPSGPGLGVEIDEHQLTRLRRH
ncbi:muconate cycloisomerase family protein [Pseudomonas sp. HT11]|uniref:muconate cycloisomerase family protein n=1 Tax=unclassified Pseudomonas TaxID=196821 RepID=UPI001197E8D7|nr:muconate cycloisomerase family protein [Pseudomonas sp. RGB]TVT89717.1 muconate cycloisomerase [Pseudomonas sp. RGB]